MSAKRSKKNSKTSPNISEMPYEDMFIPQDQIDFHGLGPMLHADIHKMIEDFIETSYRSKLTRIKIITGKGLVVRPMAVRILKRSKFVQEFRFAGYFTGQNGAIEVLLKNN